MRLPFVVSAWATAVALVIGGAAEPPRAQSAVVRSQAPAEAVGTSSVSGTIENDETPARRLRRAVVTITEASSVIQPRVMTSDEQGRFAFRNLPAGRYSVSATRPPYVRNAYGVRRVGGPGSVQTGTAIVVGAGQHVADVTVVLPHGAVITGTLRDADGQPARRLTVAASYMVRSASTGEQTPATATSASTDDRGVYRIYGLRPGAYYLSAVPPRGDGAVTSNADVARATDLLQRPGVASATVVAGSVPTQRPPQATYAYATVLFPGVVDLTQALPVTVAVGEERAGVDFQLQLVPAGRLTVVVSSPLGKPSVRVRVTPTTQGFGSQTFATYYVDEGTVVVPSLSPGPYMIEARSAEAMERVLAAIADVQVAGGDQTVNVSLHPAVSLSGRLVFEASVLAAPADLSRTRIQLSPTRQGSTLGASSVMAKTDGEFTVSNVPAGRYLLTASLPLPPHESGWYVKSATIDGRDVLEAPVEIRSGPDVGGAVITFTDRPTEIAGSMTDGTGAPAPEYFIIVFASDRAHWVPNSRRIQQTRPSSDGSFAIRNLPPGDYRLAAVVDVQQGEWFDPEFLSQLVDASVAIRLPDGAQVRQDIRIR
jgi:hypothetical protein